MAGLFKHRWGRWLPSAVVLCTSLLAPVKNAEAVANLNLSTSFTSADPARANAYMDSGGAWNGTTEVTNTTGDSFVLTVDNDLGGAGVPADTAFDVAITVDVQTGFRLPTSPYAVTVTRAPLTCPVIGGITATQAGNVITVNLPANTDILPDCRYDFEIGLTTDDVAPSVASGTYAVDFDVDYNEIDNTASSSQTVLISRNVDVRIGDVALLKTAVTPIAGDGDTVTFTVSILGAGQGGIFDVVLTDVLSPDLTGLIITPPASPPGAPGPGGNQYTFEYIAPGEQVDVTITATVAVDPNALVCPNLQNNADVIERLGTTSSFFDAVPFDLQNPFLEYTPPNVNIPFGGAGIDVTVPVQNTGTGIAKNISLNAAALNTAGYLIVVNNLLSPNWSYAAGVFTYTGTLAAGASENLVFNISVSACPPPADLNIDWIPAYQNACGTDFFPPLRFSSTTLNNVPDINVAKTVSAGAINIGNPGSYTLTLGGTNVANLPAGTFDVTDTLPLGVTGAVINTIPAGTTVDVNGSAYTAGNPIPDLANITWSGDPSTLTPLPSMQIDFVGSTGVCPPGQNIPNTATLDFPSCSINNSDTATFILNENPVGNATNNIVVGGDGNFQAGALDSDGVIDTQAREGEHIPFTVSYSFPAGFAGTWAGTSFTADLRSSLAGGVPLVLTNNRNDVHLVITRISDGATLCDADLNPAAGDFTGGDGTAAMVITDFGSLSPAGCNALPVNIADHDVLITYTATSPEGNLDGNNDPLDSANIGGYLEQTTMSVASGPGSCFGAGISDYIQAANVNIEQAVLDVSATFNGGNPVSVCEVTPVTIDVTGPAADTNSDNVQLQFNDSQFEFVSAAGAPGDPTNPTADLTYTGSLSSFNGSRTGNDIFMTPPSINDDLTADGSVSYNVILRDPALVNPMMAVQLDYDSNHTSPDGPGITDNDRDFNVSINATPFEILTGQLEMEFFPPDVILLDSVDYAFRAQITNVGTGTAVNALYRITIPAGMRFVTADVAPITVPSGNFLGQTLEWSLGDMPAGSSININIQTDINQTTCFQNPGEEILSQNEWGCGVLQQSAATPDPGIVLAPNQLTLTHDSNNSFCELCNESEIRLLVTNTGSVLLSDVDVTENLMASGLTYVANSTSYFVDGVAGPAPLAEPIVSGVNSELINWTSTQIPELANLYSAFSAGPGQPQEIEVRFRVRRFTPLNLDINGVPGPFTEEGLVSAVLDIQASAGYGLFCGPPPQTTTSNIFNLPLEQPAPEITLQGRNVDANQSAAQYTDDVFGGAQDDVIWRLTVANNSGQARADLEDLLVNNIYAFISETISPPFDINPNFNITEICNSEANATLAAAGASPGAPDCIAPSGTPVNTSEDIDDPFGNPNNDEVAAFVDTLEGGTANIFFVGRLQTLCNLTSASADIEWGCEVEPPAGGIAGGVGNVPASVVDNDSQISGTDVDAGDILVTHNITGSNPAQPLGSKGILTINITNNANGSVRNVTLTDVLPAGYALDISQVDNPGTSDVLLNAVSVIPRFGVYPGMIDTATVTNLDAATFENNTTLDISLSSTAPGTPAAPQDNLMRAGDVVTLTINIVKIAEFDVEANPDIEDETAANGEDPTITTGLLNQLSVDIRNTCGELVGTVNPTDLTVNPSPADLDITINRGDPNKTYVISNPTDTLTLDVEVTNNGGHDADDHFILVTIGSGLQATVVPGACAVFSSAPPGLLTVPRPVWDPVIPTSGVVYLCDAGSTIVPGATDTRNYVFTVQKQGLGADLTFRADVVGEITLDDGSAHVYPTPVTNVITNVANNYSLDTIRARIIGFNLTKTVTDCREQAALPALSQTANVQIGEDCTYRLSAGWFGFAAPGFGQIAIGNISIFDDVSAGQGFISQADAVTGAGAGSVVAGGFSSTPAALVPPAEILQGRWDYNIGAAANTIVDNLNIDIDVVKRTRNDAVDVSAAPNVHAAVTTDTLNVSFEVDFDGPGGQPPVVFTNGSPNYPPLSDRQVDITITEPDLTVIKTVCNESINGVGPACSTFLPLVNDGDTNDDYVYRIEITNGVGRASAFDVDITDVLDASDLLTLADFATDGLDNDGDTAIDEPDEALITITPDNVPGGGLPGRGTVNISSANSTALQRIDAGTTVTLYYRADPDDAVSPGQLLLNSVTTTYDTLAGANGAQDAPQLPNSNIGGARVYNTAAQTSTIEITALTAPPDSKGVVRLSHTALGGAVPFVGPQDVVVGEEIEYQLQVDMPVSNLGNFVIRDELPPGVRCIEAQAIDLSSNAALPSGAPPYSTAGFVPGGPAISTTCTSTGLNDVVEWDFGNQQLTTGPTYNFTATFIARVDNSVNTNEGDIIRNGGTGPGSTQATLSYEDAGGNPVVVNLGPADITVREPLIDLDKSYVVANADADDRLTVTIVATNNGLSPAYNLQVLDDLDAVANMTYVAGSNSANVVVDTATLGANQPIFSMAVPAGIAASGGTFTFTFEIDIGSTVQPLELLDNTVTASWTSLPDANTALNAGGTIGADGTPLGMRNGAIPNAGDTLNDYEATFTENTLAVPPVAITKTDQNPAVIPTIGQRKNFQLEITIPEGVTNNLVITDDLFAASALPDNAAYILENNAGFDITYTFQNIATINGAAPDEAVFTAFPADGATGNVVWNIGAIVTDRENDSASAGVNPLIRINYFARINNDAATNENDVMLNSATATYTDGESGGVATSGPVAAPQVTVQESLLTGTKVFANITPGKLATDLPDGGDIIEYTVTLSNSATTTATAFDTNIVDTLPAALQYVANSATISLNGGAAVSVEPGGGPVGPLNWGRGNADDTLDILPGQDLVLVYQVVLQDTVLADLTIDNSVFADWTSLDGVDAEERTGAGCPAIVTFNDYCTPPIIATLDSSDNNAVVKTRLTDTFVTATPNEVRIGDIIDYELRLTIQEGTSPNMVLTDVLPPGLGFEEVIAVNGDVAAPYTAVAPFTHADLAAPVVVGNTVTWNIGNIVNAADNNAANDDFVITYRARVLNLVLPQVNTTNLTNTANLDYSTAVGAATTEVEDETVVVLQPDLLVAKTANPGGGDNIIDANELIDYTVDITNNGLGPAYDTTLRDVIPLGLRDGGATITMVSTTLGGLPVANVAPVYNAVTGVATWDFDSGIADAYTILPTQTLSITYRVQADADIGAGLTMTNTAQVQLYYSFDDDAVPIVGGATGVREIYGPSNIASTTLTTPAANPLDKQNPANLNASIGEPFTYRITVPGVSQNTALHDIRILDNLALSAADLEFVSVTRVSGTEPWTPVNVGTPTNIIIQDSGVDGIDVLATQQPSPPNPPQFVELDITVQLRNQAVNVDGLLFNNTASYTFNQVDGDNGTQSVTAPVTTGDMTVVEPLDMEVDFSGPANMMFGVADTFTINAQNVGTGPAYDATLTAVLADGANGGLCDTPPNNFVAQVFAADGATPVSPVLLEGTDYVTSYSAAPACTLTVTMLTSTARIGASERLIVDFDAELDIDTLNAQTLTSIAGATQWFSADTPAGVAVGEIRTYTRTLTNGTPAVIDHEDDHDVLTQSAVLRISKTVENLTTGQAPPAPPNAAFILNAEPGDTLRYSITIQNTGPVAIPDFQLLDEPDRLTSPPGIFEPGSMSNITFPAGATNLSNINGGVSGSGIVDIQNISIDAAGGADTVTFSFDIALRPVLSSGVMAMNQAQVIVPGFNALLSDDPNLNGFDDPAVLGDEDTTNTLIGSVPNFRLQKTAQDLTGDPNVLAQGDTLRYTITAKNIGIENAVNAFMRDQVPANTTYVADSTTMNGNPVADAAGGVSPLQNGFLINAPEDPTPGAMRADASATTTNVSTIVFDVVVDTNIVNGTIISNQAFVSGEGTGSGPFPTQPSDDPATDVFGDPTQNVVGNLPILDIQKTATLIIDNLTADQVDLGDRLRYTFSISNAGSIPATGVVLTDAVPTNATYVADSVVINGTAITDAVPGTSPLIAGIDISSNDLTPPLPTPGNGTINAGRSATVTFDVDVNAATGLITNQATLTSNELPDEPSDADGNDENGDQPTVIAIGNAQQIVLTKEVQVVGGGVARTGGQLEYIIRAENVGTVVVTDLIITDDINLPVAGQLTHVTGSERMNGSAAGITFPAGVLTADFGATYGDLDAGASVTVTFTVDINASLAAGTTIDNTADVSWNAATQNTSDTATVDIGGAPGIAALNGSVWHDSDFNNVLGTNERALANWGIEIYLNSQLLDTVFTDANGQFNILGLTPSSAAGGEYELRYVAPGAGANTAMLGLADSAFSAVPYTDSLQQISGISVDAGSNSFNLNLPIDPNGVVYDAILRTPVAGVELELRRFQSLVNGVPTSQALSAACFDDPAQQNQVTLVDGYYKFDLNFGDATCPPNADYIVRVNALPTGYIGSNDAFGNPTFTSVIIPPQTNEADTAFDLPNCSGNATLDAVPATAAECEVQTSEFAPATSVPVRTAGTNYFFKFNADNTASGDEQIYNNHIPVDPELDAAIAISKTSALLNVTRSQLVPYTITLNNTLAAPLSDLDILDNFPAGFKYVAGSARLDGVPFEPTINGLQLSWPDLTINTNEVRTFKMLLVVGAGVGEGEYVNLVQAFNNRNGQAASEQASATVRVVPDPTFDCSDIIGKVYDDANHNGYQDEGETGLPSVRVVTARGIEAKTDEHGRFHLTCAVVPNEDRGSNFIIKLDDRTLPTGYRVTTENPRVERATRGKMLKFNFGATIHRVVRLDMADAVFEPNSTEMRPQWLSRISLLMEKLIDAPSVLRIAYMGDVEEPSLVEDRLQVVKDDIERRWQELDCCYKLDIETELFWRRGKPADKEAFDD